MLECVVRLLWTNKPSIKLRITSSFTPSTFKSLYQESVTKFQKQRQISDSKFWTFLFRIRNKNFLFRRWFSTLNVVFGVGVGFRFRRDVGFGRKRNGTKPNVESSFGTTEDSSSSSSFEVIRPKVGADERAATFHRMTFSQRLA